MPNRQLLWCRPLAYGISDGRLRPNNYLLSYLSGKESKIELVFLPPYAPESNPEEYLTVISRPCCELAQSVTTRMNYWKKPSLS